MNLELAKMFIDQLGMIQEKTRGNLTNEEAAVLRNTLSNLQMAFVEVSQEKRGGKAATAAQPAPRADAPESPARCLRREDRHSASPSERIGIAQEVHQELRRVRSLRVD